MGFWSTLAGAIPVVGPVISALGDLGQTAGNDAASAAQGRLQQAQVQQKQDQNAINLYEAEQKNALQSPSLLASQAVRGDLINNLQPASFSGLPSYVKMPQVSGGLSPAALGPGAHQAGAALTRNALLNLMSNKFQLPTPPQLTPLPQASGYDTFNKVLGRAGAFAGALPPNLLRGSVDGGGFQGSPTGSPLQPYGGVQFAQGGLDQQQPQMGDWIDPTWGVG